MHQTLFDEQVVSADTRHMISTAAKPRMPSRLVAAVGKHGHDSSGRVGVGHVHMHLPKLWLHALHST